MPFALPSKYSTHAEVSIMDIINSVQIVSMLGVSLEFTNALKGTESISPVTFNYVNFNSITFIQSIMLNYFFWNDYPK